MLGEGWDCMRKGAVGSAFRGRARPELAAKIEAVLVVSDLVVLLEAPGASTDSSIPPHSDLDCNYNHWLAGACDASEELGELRSYKA